LAKLPSEGAPYPILVFSAMLPWQFFSNSLSECSNSLITNANLLSKVYFPRLVVPTSAVVVSFVDFIWLRWYDRDSQWILTPAEQEKQRADLAAVEIARLKQLLAQAGMNPNV
jgi:hypothetical protein